MGNICAVEHALSLSAFVCTHKSVLWITRCDVNSLPQNISSRPTLQPFISLYLQKPSIKATGKTALTSDLNLKVWPFQELNVFLNVHCFPVYPVQTYPNLKDTIEVDGETVYLYLHLFLPLAEVDSFFCSSRNMILPPSPSQSRP